MDQSNRFLRAAAARTRDPGDSNGDMRPRLADRAFGRFDLMGLLMVHRVGLMMPGEPIVCVSAAARHRRDAIDAVDFCMDHLKSASWFWKREKRADGWHWIEPRAADYADRSRWDE